MATVGDFVKFLNAPQFQLSPITLTIKNYFQFLFRAEEELTASHVQSFFDHAMSYPHWQQHKREFSEDCYNLMTAFASEHPPGAGDANFLSEIDWPEQIEVMDVTRTPTALEVLHNFWTHRYRKKEGQFRVFEMGDGRFATVILHADHRVSVHQCNSQFLIRNGNLEPIQRNLVIHYTADLDLDPSAFHTLEVGPYVLCRFQANQGAVQGHIVRGYVFQNLQNLQGARIESHPRLFFALKRLETLFIRKESDPFYANLIENLERLVHWMRLGEPVNTVEVHEQYLRGQTALEEVFRGDKMLILLLRDLEHLAAKLTGTSELTGMPERRQPRPMPRPRTAEMANPMAIPERRQWQMNQVAAFSRSTDNPIIHEPTTRPQATPLADPRMTPAGVRVQPELDLIKSSRKADWLREGMRTSSSKMDTSPSTEKKSTSSASKSIPKKTKFSWMEN